jgi:predicted GIY-YIG superfamily endonuclease
MMTIYTLELEHGKYYVGKTNNHKQRILQHFQEKGSKWTKLYKPIKVLSQVNGDGHDEEKQTMIAMEKYGIDNVRGGSYCQVKLSQNDKDKALQTIRSISDKCYKCGNKGHFSNNCNAEIIKSAKLKILNWFMNIDNWIEIKGTKYIELDLPPFKTNCDFSEDTKDMYGLTIYKDNTNGAGNCVKEDEIHIHIKHGMHDIIKITENENLTEVDFEEHGDYIYRIFIINPYQIINNDDCKSIKFTKIC